MNLTELPAPSLVHMRVRLGRGAPLRTVPAGSEVALLREDASGAVVLRVGDDAWSVRGVDGGDERALDDVLRTSGRVCWMPSGADVGTGAELPLVVHAYPQQLVVPEPLELGVDEALCEQVGRRAFRRRAGADEVAAWLAERTIAASADGSGGDRAAITRGVGGGKGGLSAFRLLGRDLAVDVARTLSGMYVVHRVVGHGSRVGDLGPVALLCAPSIRFRDATAAGTVISAPFAPLWEQVRAADSYLEIWEAYNQLEREAVERRAGRIGALAYVERSRLPDGSWQFQLRRAEGVQAQLSGLRDGGYVELAAVRRAGEPADEGPRRGRAATVHPFAGLCAGVSVADLTVRVAEGDARGDPPPRGFLQPTLRGDRVRLKRRQEAYERLRSGRAEMPQLAPLLEGLGVPAARLRQHEPRSAAAVTVFGGEPTPRQVEALRVALNTPDIALIQGPPGTGKTRVIAALQARLGEVTSAADGLAGQILLTSFQHEAVENAAAASSVFGIPAVKVDTVARTDAFDALEKWRAERITALRAALAEREATPARLALQEAQMLHHAYRSDPAGLYGAQRLLRNLQDLARDRVPPDLYDALDELEHRIDRQRARAVPDEARPRIILAVRRLRSVPAAFEDDGAERAQAVLDALGHTELLDDGDTALLQRCASWIPGVHDAASAQVLARTAVLRDRLLDRLLGAGAARRLDTAHHDVDHLAAVVIDAMHATVARSRDGAEVVLAEYLRDLQADPVGVRKALQEYTAVLAATCQQSVSAVMAGARQARSGESGLVFDTVLVDEAARANPLDLFIPLSRARRRIVLVGDHRQLPHVLDAEVEHDLQALRAKDASGGASGAQRLRTSLFERLFTILRERERVDGIRRTVTLDTQYRMHPVLGDFVSRAFYEPYGYPLPTSSGEPRRRRKAWVKSIRRRKPVQIAWMPGSLSPLRPRKPPSAATMRTASRTLGTCSGNGRGRFEPTMKSAFHSSSSSTAVQGRSGATRATYVM